MSRMVFLMTMLVFALASGPLHAQGMAPPAEGKAAKTEATGKPVSKAKSKKTSKTIPTKGMETGSPAAGQSAK